MEIDENYLLEEMLTDNFALEETHAIETHLPQIPQLLPFFHLFV